MYNILRIIKNKTLNILIILDLIRYIIILSINNLIIKILK